MTAFDKELFFFIQSCAFIALVLIFFQNGRQCFRTFTSAFADVHIIEPILHCCFQISRNLGSQNCFYHFSNTLAGLFYTQVHTQTIFGIILKKRICPAGTMAFAVSSIRHGRRTGPPDRGTARSVGDHHAVTNKLCNQFGIRSFAAAGTGAGELKQGLFKLNAFDSIFVHRIRFGRNLMGSIIPMSSFGQLTFQRFHNQSFFFSRANLRAVAAAGAIQR